MPKFISCKGKMAQEYENLCAAIIYVKIIKINLCWNKSAQAAVEINLHQL